MQDRGSGKYQKKGDGKTGSVIKGSKVGEMIRLNRFIAGSGVCSRREADELILKGLITVNGKQVKELGYKVKRDDDVRYKNRRLSSEKKVYILMNKPKGYVTTTSDPRSNPTVMDIIGNKSGVRVYPVGRLDKNTTGVLLLTNDGELAGRLTHPKYEKKKVYHVFLDRNVSKRDLETLVTGVDIGGETVVADRVAYPLESDKSQVGIEIHSGQNRVIKKMFEALGYSVKKLDRVYFAGLTKKNLPRGKWRYLNEKEIKMLKRGIS
ncbi:MAG: pseudouridine synthase [Bacteroidales bacterium]